MSRTFVHVYIYIYISGSQYSFEDVHSSALHCGMLDSQSCRASLMLKGSRSPLALRLGSSGFAGTSWGKRFRVQTFGFKVGLGCKILCFRSLSLSTKS